MKKKEVEKWDPVYRHKTLPRPLNKTIWELENVRDFSYHKNYPKESWRTVSIDTRTVTNAWFYNISFKKLFFLQRFFSHTCLGFSFSDGTEIIFSLEARRQKGQRYDPLITGTLGGYETIYLFTTYNDLLEFRKVQRGQSLERYPLKVSQKMLENLVVKSFEVTRAITQKNKPSIYNSVTHQCTTILLSVINTVLDKKIPWHPGWHITGLAPKLLANHDLLDLSAKETV